MKYADEGVQYHLNIRKGDVGKYVLLPGDPKRCAKIAAYFDDANSLVANYFQICHYTGTLLGEKVSVTSTGIGGPMLIYCNGGRESRCRYIYRVGTCGGMKLDVTGGECCCDRCYPYGRNGKEYAPIEFPAVANLKVTNAFG